MSAAGWQVIRDVEEARCVGGQVYYPHRLQVRGHGDDFAMRLQHARFGPVLVGVLTYDTEVTISTEELRTAYEVNIPVHGRVSSWVGPTAVGANPTTVAITGPNATSTLSGFGAGSALVGLKIDRDILEAQAGAVLGRPCTGPVPFPATIDLRSLDGRAWWSLARVLVDAVTGPAPLLRNPLVAAPLVDSVLCGLLGLAGLGEDAGRACPARVRAATDFMQAHVSEPLTLSQIATAAGCGVRALQAGFREHLGCTPIGYLQRVRLAGVHADLLRADPASDTVTDVSLRWGFAHHGRFAAAYRAEYGTTPAAALHR